MPEPQYEAFNGSFFPTRQLELSAIACKYKLRAGLDVPMEFTSFFCDNEGTTEPTLIYRMEFEVDFLGRPWAFGIDTFDQSIRNHGVDWMMETNIEFICTDMARKRIEAVRHLGDARRDRDFHVNLTRRLAAS